MPAEKQQDSVEAVVEPPPVPYSVFTKGQKYALIALCAYMTLASGLTATIYLPLINLLASQYGTSTQAINLTITLYVVFQGTSPSFWTPISQTWGRRPTFLTTFALYTLASMGLVVSYRTRSYAALITLRAIQSAGGSAVLSIAYGMMADVMVPAERGKFLGLAVSNLGPCIGPVLGGGAITASGNAIWCFWTLLIFGISVLIVVGVCLPETLRKIVGNGSVPARGIWRTWWAAGKDSVRKGGPKAAGSSRADEETPSAQVANTSGNQKTDNSAEPNGKGHLTFPNPFQSARLILYPDTFLVLMLAAFPYSLWYTMQTSIPQIYGADYGFSDLGVGLSYLAGGGGVIAGGLTNTRFLDWNYRTVARRAGLPVDRVTGDAVAGFPIEHARSRGSLRLLALSLLVVVAWGWAGAHPRRVPPAVPLVLQAYVGWKCTVLHQAYSALMVDIFPDRSATAAAANNIVRCALSAVAVAILQPLVEAIGRGWVFTIFGLVDGVGSAVMVLVLRRWGKQWRDRRASIGQT
ncbi:MFS general substrate transporter [Xylariomycetidae sp. FL0641]|nr:MFS general substrate transporter [Xylariomycetidae sp. FL0641]